MSSTLALCLCLLVVVGRGSESELREQESNLPVMAYETIEPPLLYSRVKLEGDEGSRTLIVRFTRPTLFYIQLSYIAA